MASKTEDTEKGDQAFATLVIGNTYTFRNKQFKAGVAEPVDLDLAKELDALTLGSTDSRSKKKIAQHRFEIEWPEGYEPESEDGDDEETKTASSGAKRTAAKKVGGIRKPSRSSAK